MEKNKNYKEQLENTYGIHLTSQPVEIKCRVFAAMIRAGFKFSKLFNAVKELIDNAIGAQLLGNSIEIWIRVFLHEKWGWTVAVMNKGVPVPADAFQKAGNEDNKMSPMNKHGIGARAAAAVFGGLCYIVSVINKITREYRGFLLSNWTQDYCEIPDAQAQMLWESNGVEDNDITTLAMFSMDGEIAEERNTITRELIGLCYFDLLGIEKTNRSTRIFLKNEALGEEEYKLVEPIKIGGKLTGNKHDSFQITSVDENGNIITTAENDKATITAWQFEMDELLSKDALIQKGIDAQGAMVYVNGEFAAMPGVTIINGKNNKPFTSHPSFNPALHVVSITPPKDRAFDVPRDDANKASINWSCEAGKSYAKAINALIGHVYQELYDKWLDDTLNAIFFMWQQNALSATNNLKGGPVTGIFKNVKGSQFLKGMKNIDAVIAEEVNKRENPDNVCRVIKLIRTSLSYDSILALAYQVRAVNGGKITRDEDGKISNENNTRNIADGMIVCKSLPKDDNDAIQTAKSLYRDITGANLLLMTLDECAVHTQD